MSTSTYQHRISDSIEATYFIGSNELKLTKDKEKTETIQIKEPFIDEGEFQQYCELLKTIYN